MKKTKLLIEAGVILILITMSFPISVNAAPTLIWDNGDADLVNGWVCYRVGISGETNLTDDFHTSMDWNIERIEFNATNDTTYVWNDLADLVIYEDSAGLPGDEVIELLDIACTRTFRGIEWGKYWYTYEIDLVGEGIDFILPAGDYFILVRALSDGTVGQSYWMTSPAPAESTSSVYIKSAYHGFPDWTPSITALGGNYDVSFKIYGSETTASIEKHFTHTDVDFNPYHMESEILLEQDFLYGLGDFTTDDFEYYLSLTYGEIAMLTWTMTDGDSYLSTPIFDASGATTLTLDFWSLIEAYSGGSFTCYVWIDDGSGPVDVTPWTNPISVDIPGADYSIDISSFISDTVQVTFQFVGDPNVFDWWNIDNVLVTAEYLVYDPAELGTPLDSIDIVITGKNNPKVKSSNPGQFYSVATITGPIEDLVLYDVFDEEFDVNPAKLGGGIEVIMVDPDGYATVLTDDPGVSASVDNDDDVVWVYVYLDDPIPASYKLMIYIKFQTSMKHETYSGDDEFENTFWLWDWDAGDSGEYIASVTEILPINLKTK